MLPDQRKDRVQCRSPYSHASGTAVKIVYYSMAVKLSLLNVFIQFFCCLLALYVPDLENLDHRKDRVLGQVQHRSNPYKLNSVAFKFRYDCFSFS